MHDDPAVERPLYDPNAPDFQDRMFEVYRAMRDDEPVYRIAEGHYALTRYDDVRRVVSDSATFSSVAAETHTRLPMLNFMDPPRHTALRALVSRAFTPRGIAGREQRVRQIVTELLDALDPDRAEFVHGFATLLPSIVMGEMIGVPDGLLERFRVLCHESLWGTPDGRESAAAKIYELFAELLVERRARPKDDLMTALVNAEVDGEALTEPELLGFCFLLIHGGNDTTTSLLTNGIELLARHPDQRAELVAEPELLPNAIEEMLRVASPTQTLPRTAVDDVELHGTVIPAGSRVMPIFGAANLDEREFPGSERFDIHRRVDRHLAFGHGIHFCLGAPLARQEARVAFEEILRRFPDFELLEPPVRLQSSWARTFTSIVLRLTPAT